MHVIVAQLASMFIDDSIIGQFLLGVRTLTRVGSIVDVSSTLVHKKTRELEQQNGDIVRSSKGIVWVDDVEDESRNNIDTILIVRGRRGADQTVAFSMFKAPGKARYENVLEDLGSQILGQPPRLSSCGLWQSPQANKLKEGGPLPFHSVFLRHLVLKEVFEELEISEESATECTKAVEEK